MDKNQFKAFCKHEFEARGFKKVKNMFYMSGVDLLCGITLQKSNYGKFFYINYYYFLGDYNTDTKLPSYQERDVEGRIRVLSKKQTFQGKNFLTAQVEYEEYTEAELKIFFEHEFNEVILPPLIQGKKYIFDKLNKLYFLTLNRDEVMGKLRS